MGGHTFVGDEMEQEAAQSFIDLIYATADGFISVAVMRHTEWVGLSRAVGRPEWLEDPRFQDTEGLEEHKNARLELTQDTGGSAAPAGRNVAPGPQCCDVLGDARRAPLRSARMRFDSSTASRANTESRSTWR